MKRKIPVLVSTFCILTSTLLLAGCAMVNVKTKSWSMSAGSVFKKIEIPKVNIGANGSVRVEGYKGNVDGEAAGAAIGTAAKVLVKP